MKISACLVTNHSTILIRNENTTAKLKTRIYFN